MPGLFLTLIAFLLQALLGHNLLTLLIYDLLTLLYDKLLLLALLYDLTHLLLIKGMNGIDFLLKLANPLLVSRFYLALLSFEFSLVLHFH